LVVSNGKNLLTAYDLTPYLWSLYILRSVVDKWNFDCLSKISQSLPV